MKTCIINLEDYRTVNGSQKSRVFTGKDRGREVRKKSHLDKLYAANDVIEIIIPDDIFSITPSFLEEFIFNIIKKYGKDEVIAKLNFIGSYNITEPLYEAIDRIKLIKKPSAWNNIIRRLFGNI